MISIDGATAHRAMGTPTPIMDTIVTSGDRSGARGRQVQSNDPMNDPAATAVSSSPLLAGACSEAASRAATTASAPGPTWPSVVQSVTALSTGLLRIS